VWFVPSLVVEHRESPKERNQLRRHQLNARNELWSVWLRCPWPWLLLVSAYRMAREFTYAWSEGLSWVAREPLWWFAAVKGIAKCCQQRQPIPWAIYYRWMRLERKPLYFAQQLQREFSLSGVGPDGMHDKVGNQSADTIPKLPFGSRSSSSLR
jgi:hypothetical protein